MIDDCGQGQGPAETEMGAASAMLDHLAEPRRLTILWHLARGTKTSDALVGATGLAPGTVTEALRELLAIGFVAASGPPAARLYALDDSQVERVIELLDELFGP
jgi:DNA-binding HxlR family transcriptional regulator